MSNQQVSLRRSSDGSHFCGGSVIGPNHVVSAAHCTVIWDSPSEVIVVAGEHDRSVDEGTEQTVSVVKLTVHESYGSPKNFENDIAIWELGEPLEMNDYVAPVTLPEPMQQSEGDCICTVKVTVLYQVGVPFTQVSLKGKNTL